MAEEILKVTVDQLATQAINSSDWVLGSKGSSMYKNTYAALANFIGSVGVLGYKGAIAATDTPGEDGFYFASESGTYNNAGGVVVDLNAGINMISVTGGQAVFDLIVIPVDLSSQLVQTVNEGETAEAPSSDAVVKYAKNLKTDSVFSILDIDPVIDIREIKLYGADQNHTYYLQRAANAYDSTEDRNEVIIEITSATGGAIGENVVCNFILYGGGLLSGVSTVKLSELNNSGITGEATVNWDALTGASTLPIPNVFEYPIKRMAQTRKYDPTLAFKSDSPKILKAITRVTSSNPDVKSKNIYLAAISNNSNVFRFRIEENDGVSYSIIGFMTINNPEVRTGIETLHLPDYNSSGYHFDITINWDLFDDALEAFNTNGLEDYKLAVDYVKSTYPFYGGAVDPVDIRDIVPLGFDEAFLFGSDYFPNTFKIGRVYNWFDSRSGDYRALVQIVDDTDNVVAQYFQQALPDVKSGIETIVLNAKNNGKIDWGLKINWDALAGYSSGSNNLGYRILNEIIWKASNSSENFVKAFSNMRSKTYSAIDKCQTYLTKLLSKSEDVNIVLLGDSLTARTASVSQLSATEQQTAPVWFNSKTWGKWLYDFYVENKPEFKRFDSGAFNEGGSGWEDGYDIFEGTGGVPAWTRASRQEGNASRYTTAANASVSFSWDLSAFANLNFIYDKDYRAAHAVTLDVSGGDGNIEVWNGASWVEANGYVLNPWIDSSVATEGSGNAWIVNKLRLKMRSVGASVQILTFTKDATNDYFFYWGIEQWNEQTIHIHNAGRGGHDAGVELPKSTKDLAEYSPDLIIFQLPLINEINSFSTASEIVNHIHDYVWGDRSGNLNPDSLKNIYPTADILCIIPHIDAENWSGDTPVIGLAGTLNDDTGLNVAYRCKSLFMGRADIGYIDILSEQLEIARINGWTIEEAFTGSVNAQVPASFNRDNSHQGDYGSLIWADIILSNLKY